MVTAVFAGSALCATFVHVGEFLQERSVVGECIIVIGVGQFCNHFQAEQAQDR